LENLIKAIISRKDPDLNEALIEFLNSFNQDLKLVASLVNANEALLKSFQRLKTGTKDG